MRPPGDSNKNNLQLIDLDENGPLKICGFFFFINSKVKRLKLSSNPLYSKATLANLSNDCEFACDCMIHGFFYWTDPFCTALQSNYLLMWKYCLVLLWVYQHFYRYGKYVTLKLVVYFCLFLRAHVIKQYAHTLEYLFWWWPLRLKIATSSLWSLEWHTCFPRRGWWPGFHHRLGPVWSGPAAQFSWHLTQIISCGQATALSRDVLVSNILTWQGARTRPDWLQLTKCRRPSAC